MPLPAVIKVHRLGSVPSGRLSGLARRLNRQFWTHLLPLVLMVLLCSWLTLQAAGAIDRGKSAPDAVAVSVSG